MTTLFHLSILLVIANAMPDFYRSMKERLRTPEQGSDTVVWLAVSEAAVANHSGGFFQGMNNMHTKLYIGSNKCKKNKNK